MFPTLLLATLITSAPLPKLDKVWRTELPGSSGGLHFTSTGELLLNIRLIEWQNQQYHREFDKVFSLCSAGKLTEHFSFPDKTRGHAFTRDCKYCVILQGYQGHNLELWDVGSGKALRRTNNEVFKTRYSRLTLHPLSQQFLVVENDEVQHWDMLTLSKKESLKQPEGLWLAQLRITEQGELLGLYARNYNYAKQPGDMVVWDFRQQKIVREIKLINSPRHIGWTADGSYLYHAAETGALRLWKHGCTNAEPDFMLVGHTKPSHIVKAHSRLPLLASTSEDNSVILWDLQTSKAIARNTFPRNGYSMDVAFAPDDKHLYVSGNTQKTTPDGKYAWMGFVTQFRLSGGTRE